MPELKELRKASLDLLQKRGISLWKPHLRQNLLRITRRSYLNYGSYLTDLLLLI